MKKYMSILLASSLLLCGCSTFHVDLAGWNFNISNMMNPNKQENQTDLSSNPQNQSQQDEKDPADSLDSASSQDDPKDPNDKEPKKSSTILQLFQTAVQPVGQTLYIWGGAWNKEDTGGGIESVTIGLPSAWKDFYEQQDASYDYTLHNYEIHNGLDCSGYIGWLVYNTLETEDDNPSYVALSPNQTTLLAGRGLGEVILKDQIVDVMPGDIFSSQNHIYLLVKAFEDGSRLILHASPPGVQFSGTPDSNGNEDSEAVYWADQIMSQYYPDYYERYPSVVVDGSYNYYDQFRFSDAVISGKDKADSIKIEELIDLIMQIPVPASSENQDAEQNADSSQNEENQEQGTEQPSE